MKREAPIKRKRRLEREAKSIRQDKSSNGSTTISSKAWLRPPNPKRFARHQSKPHSPGT